VHTADALHASDSAHWHPILFSFFVTHLFLLFVVFSLLLFSFL